MIIFSPANRCHQFPTEPEMRERQLRPILRHRDNSVAPIPAPTPTPEPPHDETIPLLRSRANEHIDLDTEHAMYERI